jgi:DNA-binding NarL/FixJ family response regulator
MIISILLVDDHALFRQGLQLLLETQPDFHVVGLAGDGSEALIAARQLKPDIIVLDMLMPGMNGLETLRHMQQVVPQSRVIILSMSDEEGFLHSALHEGARGYILKDTSAEDLLLAVRSVLAGKTYLSPSLLERVIQSYLRNPLHIESGSSVLTNREQQVLQLSAGGLSGPEIARELSISPRTVETHRANLMHKLGLHSQAELINYARLNHLILS